VSLTRSQSHNLVLLIHAVCWSYWSWSSVWTSYGHIRLYCSMHVSYICVIRDCVTSTSLIWSQNGNCA